MTIKEEPKTWKDLQGIVGEIFQQCNFVVEIEKKIKSARSTIEIDVYAEELIDGRTYSVICECKYWKTNIPQLYIHALRTVANDTGINKAIIVTTSEFQSGAINSIEQTNVELLSWQDFQKTFFKTWYINYFSKKIHEIITLKYDHTAIQFFDNFELIEKDKFRTLIDKYNHLQEISQHFPSGLLRDFAEYFTDIENKLPLITQISSEIREEWDLIGCDLPSEILEETNYSTFIDLLEKFVIPVYTELDKLNLYLED